MSLKQIACLFLSLCVLFGGGAEALAKSSSKKKRKSSRSKIISLRNEAAVYEAPNFDAPVKIFLPQGRKVRYFFKRYKGPGGFGVFYRVKFRKKGYGYVVEDDIHPPNQKPEDSKDEGLIGPFGDAPFEFETSPNLGDSIYLSRYVGLSYSSVNYTEAAFGQKFAEPNPFFGLKFSGPGVLVEAPLDINMMLLFGAPSYYRKFSYAGGFLLLSDIVFMLPLLEWKDFLVYYGLGPFLSYSMYNVKFKELRNSNWESQEVRMGASFPLGAAIRFNKKFLIKAEVKYYFEQERYFGFQAAFQWSY